MRLYTVRENYGFVIFSSSKMTNFLTEKKTHFENEEILKYYTGNTFVDVNPSSFETVVG